MASDSFQIMGMADQGQLPKALARRSKYDTPTVPILLSAIGVLALGLFVRLAVRSVVDQSMHPLPSQDYHHTHPSFSVVSPCRSGKLDFEAIVELVNVLYVFAGRQFSRFGSSCNVGKEIQAPFFDVQGWAAL